jgi:hypothetical protein
MQKTLFLLFAVCTLAIACKKSKTAPNDEPVHRVKTITNSGGGVSLYEYDSEGRISKTTEASGRWEYTYSSNLATENVYNSTGTLTTTNHHELNANGLVVKTTFVLPAFPDYSTCTYNSSKMITEEQAHSGATIVKYMYYYTGTRLDSVRLINNGQLTRRQLYEYSDTNNTVSNQHTGFAMFGRQSPKALRKLTYYYYNASGVLINTQINNYNYELDAQGRITREMMNSTPAGIARDNHYTYY